MQTEKTPFEIDEIKRRINRWDLGYYRRKHAINRQPEMAEYYEKQKAEIEKLRAELRRIE